MLILTRRIGETIHIGDDVVIQVVRTGLSVRIGISAPQETRIVRGEIRDTPFEKASSIGIGSPVVIRE